MGKSEQGVEASVRRYQVIPRVLVFVFNEGDVLLLRGAPTKRIWANCYNGVGGHVEAKEDVYSAARRETREETGLDVYDLRCRGMINIDAGQETGILLTIFTARSDERQTVPSEEGVLEWVPLGGIQQLDLVADVPVLLNRIAEMPDDAPPFSARYFYDDHDQLQITFAEID
jgi:8-oxo-dGTP diphosphatase